MNNLGLPIPLKILKVLLPSCIDKVRFTFEGEYLPQIDGIGIDSPLGPVLADVFISYIENLTENLIENMSLK